MTPSLAPSLAVVSPMVWLFVAGAFGLGLGSSLPVRWRGGVRIVSVGGALISLVLALQALLGASTWLDGAVEVLEGGLIADRMSVAFDVAISAVVLGVAAVPGSDGADGREDWLDAPLVLLAGAATMALGHAGDLIVVIAAAELVGLTVVALARRDRTAARRFLGWWWTAGAVTLVGVAFIYGGISTTRIDGMSERVATVFNQWNAIDQHAKLLETATNLPSGLKAQLEGKVITGMAPAALFLAGTVLFLGAVLARLGVLPMGHASAVLGTRVGTRVSAVAAILVPMGALALILRVFVGMFHAPRMVNEPYGWAGIVPALAVGTLLWSSWAALRARDLRTQLTSLARASMAVLLFLAVVAANFYGHRNIADGAVSAVFEVQWSQRSGDETMAAVLLTLVVDAIALTGAFVVLGLAERQGDGRGWSAWWGAAHRARFRGPSRALTVCLASLAGLPLLAGFVARLAVLRALTEHSELRWVAVLMVVGWALCIVATARTVARLHATPSTPDETTDRKLDPLARVVAYAAAITLVVGAVYGDALVRSAREAAAGASMGIDTRSRRNWVESTRVRTRAEARSFDAE